MKSMPAWLAVLLIAASAHAEERILSYHSEIAVAADAGMEVTETIRVRTEGKRIRHGIYRDFPTRYRDAGGNRVRVEFTPLAVTRDGVAEPFRTEALGNGTRVYAGSKDVTLEPGEYTFAIRYRTTRQLGFFDDHDELYWNVTGNGWDFPIDEASATVSLPGAIMPASMTIEGYTGPQGTKGQDLVATIEGPSRVAIRTTRALAPGEGLTLVVTFPKGVVAEPTREQRAQWFLRDNTAVLIAGIGLAVLWLYFLWQWFRVGRDPEAGVIIPQYDAPPGVSPGSMRHIERMAYDDRCFAADLVALAVDGALEIDHDDGTYRLVRTREPGTDVPEPARKLFDSIFAGRADRLVLERSQHQRIRAARKTHRKALEQQNLGRHFNTNTRYTVIGIVIALVTLVVGVIGSGSVPMMAGGGFMLAWLAGWSVGVFSLVLGAINAWRSRSGLAGSIGALFLTLFAVPFVIGELVGIGFFVAIVGAGFAAIAAALVATSALFRHLMKAPTVAGRKLLDRIEGLRLYLGVAERDALAKLRAPKMDADEFQRMLPYALALDVETTWANRFADAVGPAAVEEATRSMGWYRAGSSAAGIAALSSGLGSSLSGAIASSSTAPGSSSGSGGRGSSGGGGGGGGGGGW